MVRVGRDIPRESLKKFSTTFLLIAIYGQTAIVLIVLLAAPFFFRISFFHLDNPVSLILLPVLIFNCAIWATFIIYVGIRVYLFIFAVFRDPVLTIAMVPSVWVSRQFRTDLLSRYELVPGLALNSVFDSDRLGRWRVWGSPWLYLTTQTVALLCCIVARFFFKLGAMPCLILAYLAGSLRQRAEDLRAFTLYHREQRTNLIWAIVSMLVLAAFLIKMALYYKLYSVGIEASSDLIKYWIAPTHIPLWQMVSLANALVFLVAVYVIDRSYTLITRMPNRSPEWHWVRVVEFLLRFRSVSVLYVWLCLIILAVPKIREFGLPIVNLRLFPQ
jgi:hypothetical protein